MNNLSVVIEIEFSLVCDAYINVMSSGTVPTVTQVSEEIAKICPHAERDDLSFSEEKIRNILYMNKMTHFYAGVEYFRSQGSIFPFYNTQIFRLK